MDTTNRLGPVVLALVGVLTGGCFSASSGGASPDAGFKVPDAGIEFDASGSDAPVESGPAGTFTTGQPAVLVLGQPTLTSTDTPTCTATSMATPVGIKQIGSALYVAAESDHRVLVWNSMPTTTNQPADRVLGQPTLGTGNKATECAANAGGTMGGNTLDYPADMASDGTVLAVLDHGNNRVLVFDTIPTTGNGATASYALNESGVTAGTSGGCSPSTSALELEQPQGIVLAGGKLVVADTGNNRTLIWNTVPASANPFKPEDVLLGQASDTSCTATTGSAVTPQTQNSPGGVWSDGTRLAVADTQNNRVLVWTSFPSTANKAPDLVLGPALGAAGSLNAPAAVTSNGTQLIVADTSNNRVLVWNTFPGSGAQAPDAVLGQASMTATGSGGGASGLSQPRGVLLEGGRLWVSDTNSNRVVRY